MDLFSLWASIKRDYGKRFSQQMHLDDGLDASKIVKRALKDPTVRAALYDAFQEEARRRKQQK